MSYVTLKIKREAIRRLIKSGIDKLTSTNARSNVNWLTLGDTLAQVEDWKKKEDG